jgi:transcriptional regulator with XRE-family HTH domain
MPAAPKDVTVRHSVGVRGVVVPRLCAGCGVPLSRYNRQTVCGACAHATRGIDDPEDGVGTPELAIGAHLAQLRHQAGLTRQQLADRCGVSADLIKKLEQGARTSARLTSVVALARGLRVPVSALLEPASSPGLSVRAARRRRGWSLALVAARAGFSVSYLSQIENGQRPLSSLRTIRAIANALGVLPAQLVPWLGADSNSSGHACSWCGSTATPLSSSAEPAAGLVDGPPKPRKCAS